MIRKVKKIKIISIIGIFLLVNFLWMPSLRVSATHRRGDIEIDFEGRTDTKDHIPLAGATFIIYPLQDMDDDGTVTWRSSFAKAGVSLDDTSAGAREKQAQKLFQYARANDISGLIHMTDGSGHTFFRDLPQGVYLIGEIGDVEIGLNEFESAPFIVTIPPGMPDTEEDDDYEVDVHPKARWIPRRTTSTSTSTQTTSTSTGATTEQTTGTSTSTSTNTSTQTTSTSTGATTEHTTGNSTEHTTGISTQTTTENPKDKIRRTTVTVPKKVKVNPGVKKILKIVKTGDNAKLIVWTCQMCISMIVILLLCRKKK